MDRDVVDLGIRPSAKRTQRQIKEQHQEIDRLFLTLIRATADPRKSGTRAAFDRYQIVISDHFALEEQVFFPVIQVENPSRRPEIERLIHSHDRLLDELAQMEEQLESLSREDYSRRLHSFATMLEIHETQEAALVSATADAQVA
jgi:hemerythrin-like domain-containing protein